MKFEFYEELPAEVIDSLWKQNVTMDDWSYLLFFQDATQFVTSEHFDIKLEPKKYYVGELLRGCCSNKWYPVTDFMGRPGILGMAYHG